MSHIDDLDLEILRRLQTDTRRKSEAIGEEIGLSATAVQRRIKRLRESGAIAGEVAVIDPETVGGRVTVIVGVVLERGGAHIVEDFKRAVRKVPAVQQCYYVTGDFDFILVVSAKTMTEYETLTRELFFDNPNIRRFQTSVTMDTVKRGLQIPI